MFWLLGFINISDNFCFCNLISTHTQINPFVKIGRIFQFWKTDCSKQINHISFHCCRYKVKEHRPVFLLPKLTQKDMIQPQGRTELLSPHHKQQQGTRNNNKFFFWIKMHNFFLLFLKSAVRVYIINRHFLPKYSLVCNFPWQHKCASKLCEELLASDKPNLETLLKC